MPSANSSNDDGKRTSCCPRSELLTRPDRITSITNAPLGPSDCAERRAQPRATASTERPWPKRPAAPWTSDITSAVGWTRILVRSSGASKSLMVITGRLSIWPAPVRPPAGPSSRWGRSG